MKVKCERCGRIRDLFQYTKFVPQKTIQTIKSRIQDGKKFYYEDWETINESQGLCEECAVEINKKQYDKNQ